MYSPTSCIRSTFAFGSRGDIGCAAAAIWTLCGAISRDRGCENTAALRGSRFYVLLSYAQQGRRIFMAKRMLANVCCSRMVVDVKKLT